jgi:structure-specific recognition protein 1
MDQELFIENRLAQVFQDLKLDGETIKKFLKSNKKFQQKAKKTINDNVANDKTNKKEKNVKKQKDPNAPRSNYSAYLFFSIEKRKELSKVTMRELGDMWKALNDKERDPYVKQAKLDKERYEQEKNEYENLKKEKIN